MPKTRCGSKRPGTDGAVLTCLGFLKAGGGGWRREQTGGREGRGPAEQSFVYMIFKGAALAPAGRRERQREVALP